MACKIIGKKWINNELTEWRHSVWISQQWWSLMKSREKLVASNCKASLIELFPAIIAGHSTCVFVSYVFIVVKTHIRPFAVSWILSQLAWIWSFSWRAVLRKMSFSFSNRATLINTFNNNNVLTFISPPKMISERSTHKSLWKIPCIFSFSMLCNWWLKVIVLLCPWQH